LLESSFHVKEWPRTRNVGLPESDIAHELKQLNAADDRLATCAAAGVAWQGRPSPSNVRLDVFVPGKAE
jgi:hypothetical protein